MAQLLKNLPAMWETWVRSLGWEDPLEKGKPSTPVLPVALAIACLSQTAILLLVPNKLIFFLFFFLKRVFFVCVTFFKSLLNLL